MTSGLTILQTANPARVLGFLDLAGDRDPSLAVVLAWAVATAAVEFRLVQQADHACVFALDLSCRLYIPAESFYFVLSVAAAVTAGL